MSRRSNFATFVAKLRKVEKHTKGKLTFLFISGQVPTTDSPIEERNFCKPMSQNAVFIRYLVRR